MLRAQFITTILMTQILIYNYSPRDQSLIYNYITHDQSLIIYNYNLLMIRA